MRVAGASHVSFSVNDFDRTLRWYREVFEAEVMLDEPAEHRHAAVLRLPGTDLLIGICQFYEHDEASFDPTRIGLDHFAFSVESRHALAELGRDGACVTDALLSSVLAAFRALPGA